MLTREPAPEVSGEIAAGPGQMPDAPPPAALDRRVLGSLGTLDADTPGFLRQIVGEFHEAASRRLAAIAEALRAGDAQALSFEAHGLRGSCGTLGASRMAILAGRLEALGRGSRTADGLPLLPALEREYQAVRRALDAAGPTTAAHAA